MLKLKYEFVRTKKKCILGFKNVKLITQIVSILGVESTSLYMQTEMCVF